MHVFYRNTFLSNSLLIVSVNNTFKILDVVQLNLFAHRFQLFAQSSLNNAYTTMHSFHNVSLIFTLYEGIHIKVNIHKNK